MWMPEGMYAVFLWDSAQASSYRKEKLTVFGGVKVLISYVGG